MDFFIVAGIIGGLAGGLAVLVVGLLLPRRSCPRCHSSLPRVRLPASLREALLGGWRCPACSVRIARDGALLPD
jgi:transposase-like protein